jgi:hypothetical protein
MIRRDFTSASIEFWKKHQAEKLAIQQSNLKKGIFMVVMFPILFLLLLLVASKVHATGLTDLKFGQAQIADSQWNVQACTQTATCQIYSKNPGTAYRIPWTSGQLSWAAGDYVAFATTGNSANPYNAVQYNSAGQQKSVMGTGHIINMGSDYFFFVGNDNNTGQLFSMTSGFNNTAGVTWTGTLNPTVAQVNAYAAGGSTTPLSAGQTAAPPPTNNTTAAGTMPGGYIGRVLNNSPATWQTYSFTFTPTQSGSNYVMLSFRQDPAYWSVDNISVTAAGSTTNLLRNGGMDTGGTITAQTNNGPTQVSTPTYWGVAYQAGIYPGAAGSWNSSIWYDGAVGSFDAIYQGLNLTAGVTYTLSFMVAGDNVADSNLSGAVQLGVYAGPCGSLSMAPDQCLLPSTSGYTTLATPSDGASAGNAAPTETGSSTSNNVSTSTSTTTSNVTNQYSASNYTYGFIGTITNTTVTTVTTPITTHYWSDGSTTTTTGSSSTSQTVTPSYVINPNQSLTPADRNPFRGTLVNSIDITQTLGSANNTIQAAQKGQGNNIQMTVSGQTNRVNAEQGFTVTNGVPVESMIVSNNNFASLSVVGNNNTVASQQTGLMNSAIIDISGNYNNIKSSQNGNNNQSYTSVTGNNNNSAVTQSGNNNLSAITTQGYGNSVTVGQSGNGNGALVNAQNAGGPVTVNLLQQTATQGNTFVVQQTCTNGAGCSVSVQQNR